MFSYIADPERLGNRTGGGIGVILTSLSKEGAVNFLQEKANSRRLSFQGTNKKF